MPRTKSQLPAASPEYQLAAIKAAMRDLEERHAIQLAERDQYIEEIEQKALTALEQRNHIEEQLVTLLDLREINAAAVLPGAYPSDVIEQVVRRVSLALSAGDVPRAHRSINDTIETAQVPLEKVTEATLLCQTDLFDYRITSGLEGRGIITVGDLTERSEEDIHFQDRKFRGNSLGGRSLAVVFEVRRKLLGVLVKSADAMATRRATA